MPTHTGRAHELVTLLGHTDDPLRVAAAMATQERDAGAAHEIVEAATQAFGRRINARSLQALARYARSAAKAAGEQATADRFLKISSPAGQWLGAMALEALGRHDRAAAVLNEMEDGSWREERALRLLALARNLMRAGQIADAWHPLRQAALAVETRQTAVAIGQLIAEGARTTTPPARAVRRVALLGTGTLQFWADVLRPALFGAGIAAEIFVGDFGQYQQELLDAESPLAAFRPDIVLLAVDYRSLGLPDVSSDPDALVDATVDRFRQLWSACQQRFAATVVQCNFEIPEVDPFGGLSASLPGGRARVLHRLNLQLRDAAQRTHVAVFDMNEAAAVYGKQAWNDAALWIAAKQYPAADAGPFLARRIASLVRASCGLTSKCLVLDLDGTLWGGVIGEDGLAGIRLGGDPEGEAYAAFHRYILGLRHRGIPLAICSKNNEADALSVFREHPESVLKEQDFAVVLANWEPKPDNLRRVASMLNIGIDSLVFLDDNPMERNFIRKELPDVEVPELPDDPALYTEALHRSGLFESLTFTAEDLHRADSYRQNAERAELAAGVADLDAYLSDLRMELELRPFDDLNLPRIVQLINKTNQFNLTTRRVTTADVTGWMRDPACYTQFMRLRDRFGDSGLTGVLVAFREDDVFRIDTWLMSCRVLGRRIETAMLASLCEYAIGSGARAIVGEYIPTEKNEQVKTLYDRLGFEQLAPFEHGTRHELRLDTATLPSTPWFDVDDSTATSSSRAAGRTRDEL